MEWLIMLCYIIKASRQEIIVALGLPVEAVSQYGEGQALVAMQAAILVIACRT